MIGMLIGVGMKGICYKGMSSNALVCGKLFIQGFGGVVVAFMGIKVIDLVVGVLI